MTKLIESNYEMVNGKYYLLLETGKRPSDEVTDNPNDIASLGGENISEEGFMKFDNVRYITKKYFNTINKGKIQKEDILINKDGAQTGKIAYISEIPFGKSMINEHIFIIRNNGEFDQKFLFYFLLSFKGQKQIKSKIVGSAQGGISNSFIKGLYLPKPKKSTQEKIASILSTVDKNIEQTQKTIEKAEKLKKSMMQNLLTGMIKPDGSKRREDEFYIDDKFGKVPKGWDIGKVKDFFLLQRGYDLPDSQVKNGKYPVVKSNGVDIYHNKFKEIGPGVITGRSGSIGNVNYINSNYWPHNTSLFVKDFKGNHLKFIYYYLQYMHLERLLAGTSVPTLNRNDVHRIKIAFPLNNEQKQITKILDLIINRINNLDFKLSKLQNLKKSLMQNLLTGKIEVK